MAVIFYPTGGNLSALTPKKTVSSYLTPLMTGGQYDALNTERYIAFTPSEAGTCIGVVLGIGTNTTMGTNYVLAKLQEKIFGVWTDVAGVTCSRYNTVAGILGTHGRTYSLGYVYFQFGVSYAVTMDADRWRITISSNSNENYIRKNGTSYGHAVVIDTNTAFAGGDSVFLADGQSFTLDQSMTIATLNPGTNTHLDWQNPPAISYILTVTSLYQSSCFRFTCGSAVSPIPLAQRATLAITTWYRASAWDPGYECNPEIEIYGVKPTNNYTTLASNAVSGQPILITSTDMSGDWQIGDTLIIIARDNNGNYETFVIQNIVGTTITLNGNLAATHYAGWAIINWSKANQTGVLCTSGILAGNAITFKISGVYLSGASLAITPNSGNAPVYAYDSARVTPLLLDTIFASASCYISADTYMCSATGLLGSVATQIFILNAPYGNALAANFSASGSLAISQSILMTGSAGPTVSLYNNSSISNCQYVDFSGTYCALYLTLVGSVMSNTKVFAGPYVLCLTLTAIKATLNNIWLEYGYCELTLNQIIDTIISNVQFGQQKAPTRASISDNTQFIQLVLKNCSAFTLTGGTTIPNAQTGSFIAAHQYGGAVNDHRIWFKTGRLQSVGDGLADTTVHTVGAGRFAVRLEPQSGTNLFNDWSFTCPTGNIQGQTMTVGIWCKLNNSAYWAGTHQMPRLMINYDDGTVVYAEAAQNTNWQLLSVVFTPATTYGEITITLSGRTDAVGSNRYIYWDDALVLYPPGYVLDMGGLDLWANALPITPPITTVFSAMDVWEAQTSAMTGAGTIGKRLADNVDTTITSRAPAATALSTVQWTNGRAALLDYLDAAITSRLASAGYTAPDNAGIAAIWAAVDTEIGAIKAKTDLLPASPAATGDAMALTPAYDAAKTAAQAGDQMALTGAAIDAILDDAVEGSLTLRQLIRGIAAVLLGVSSGMGDEAPTFKAAGGATTRVSGSQDDDGNRPTVVLNL